MKHLVLLMAAAMLTIVGCNKITPKPSLSSDDDKTVYSIGVDMGTKLKALQLSKKEMAILKMGLDDGSEGAKPKVEMKEFIMKVGPMIRKRGQEFAEKEKKQASAFMTKAVAEKGAQKTDTGLVYVETAAGSGDQPKPSDRVKVNYHGTLRDGTVFDSTRERGNPAVFRLDRVIKCWTEGVQKMKVGGKSTLYCPPEIAYGDRGAPPKIPPGAALKFEVELLEIVKQEKSMPKPGAKTGKAKPAGHPKTK